MFVLNARLFLFERALILFLNARSCFCLNARLFVVERAFIFVVERAFLFERAFICLFVVGRAFLFFLDARLFCCC